MSGFALASAFSGFVALCLAMEKHQLDLYGRERATPRRRRGFRIVGWSLLALAFALCVSDSGWALGPVLWLGALTASGLLVALWLLPYRPRLVLPAACAAPVLAAVAGLLSYLS